MSRTVVQMLKEFLDRDLAMQFVGALVRKGKGLYVFADTALYRAMKGKCKNFNFRKYHIKLLACINIGYDFHLSDVLLAGQPEIQWNAIVADLRKSVSVVLSNSRKWRSRCLETDEHVAPEGAREREGPSEHEGHSEPEGGNRPGDDEPHTDDLIQEILCEANELIAPELLSNIQEEA